MNFLKRSVCEICEKFGGSWWSFSWLGQKIKDSN